MTRFGGKKHVSVTGRYNEMEEGENDANDEEVRVASAKVVQAKPSIFRRLPSPAPSAEANGGNYNDNAVSAPASTGSSSGGNSDTKRTASSESGGHVSSGTVCAECGRKMKGAANCLSGRCILCCKDPNCTYHEASRLRKENEAVLLSGGSDVSR